MNKVIHIGRLTADPEVRVTQTGKKVVSFSMAVDDGKSKEGEKKAQFFNYTAWGSEYNKTAEVVENYVKKGHRLAVEGKLQNKSWEKKDGTKGYATDINVFSVEMLTSKSEAGATPSAPKEEIGEINMPPSEEMPF